MKAIIIGGGNAPSLELLKKELKDANFIICADGGSNILYKYNITPHYIIGDLDSISYDVLTFFKNKEVNFEKFPKDKDFTDGNLAVQKAIDLNADEIVLLGFLGDRLDHVLANLGLLKLCLDKNVKAYIRDEKNKIILSNKNVILKNEIGKYFSLQAFGQEVIGITLKNAKFPLNNYNLSIGDTLTTSNEFLNEDVEISFKKGILIIMITND